MGNLLKLPGHVSSALDAPGAFKEALAFAAGALIGRGPHGRLPRERFSLFCYTPAGLDGLELAWDAPRAVLTA